MLLAGSLAVGLVAGCTPSPSSSGGRTPSATPSPPPPPPDPDLPALRRSLASERLLAAAIVATGRKYPALAKALAPYASRHQQHVVALGPAAPSASPSPAPAVVPPKQGAALAALIKSSQSAQVVHHAALRTVKSSDNALLLASLAACAAAHAAALADLSDLSELADAD